MPDTISIDSLQAIHNDSCVMYISPEMSPPDQMAVKVLRTTEGNRPETTQQYREMMNYLRQQMIPEIPEHPNVSQMRIQDVVMKGHFIPAIVMPVYTAGNILEVVRRVPGVDMLSLVNGAAKGLAHLHSKGIWHGNVHPNNILVSEDGRACISDVRVQALTCSIVNPDLPNPSTWFYKPPDAFERRICSMEEDVYSFACTVYVVYNRRVAAFEPNPTLYLQGLQYILEQRIIGKPKLMPQKIWELLQECWASDSSKRPTMQQVAARLGALKGDVMNRRQPTLWHAWFWSPLIRAFRVLWNKYGWCK